MGGPELEDAIRSIHAYAGTGHELIRLARSKVPPKGWREASPLKMAAAEECLRGGHNVGVRLRPVDLVVDIDPRNFPDGDNPKARLEQDLGIELNDFPHVVTGGGGSHFYMTKPADFAVRETLSAYPGIEFKSLGRQVVAAASLHESGRRYIWDNDPLAVHLRDVRPAPDVLLRLLEAARSAPSSEAGLRSDEDLAAMLSGLDVFDYRDHDRWLELMMACHDATAGTGRAEWIEWSTQDPNYAGAGEEIGSRWDSLGRPKAGSRVTERTLFKALIEAGRGDLIPPSDPAGDFPADPSSLDIADSWVWVADAKQFVRRTDGKKYGQEQWKSLYASLLPEGDVLTAIWKKRLPVRTFESLVYVPGSPEFPDGERGQLYNTWRFTGVQPIEGDVAVFLDHMTYLFPDETDRDYVLDYLALFVQRPEVKMNFALLIQGTQGTGKSWVGQLLERIVGCSNVVRPSNDEVTSHWTAWMEGAQLAIIEELMTLGRLEVSNRLKPVITDAKIRIEQKGVSHYSIPNHLNLICFTNHEDALRIERGDRRWLVLFSPAEPRGDAYYDRLFNSLDGGGAAAVSHWLHNRQIRLNPKGRAPATSAKAQMQAATMDDVEASIRDLLDARTAPFDFDLVRIEDVLEVLPTDVRAHGRNLRQRVAQALRSAGALSPPRYTKGGRPSHQLWIVANHDQWLEAGAACRIDAFCAHLPESGKPQG